MTNATRRIEWVGQTPLLSNPTVRAGLAGNQMSLEQKKVIRAAAKMRRVRVPGSTAREILARHIPGLSRSYQWGPDADSYVQEMPPGDAALILGCADGSEFLDVTDVEDEPRIITR